MPFLPINVAKIQERISAGIALTTKGEFKEALRTFRACLQSTSLLAVQSQAEEQKIKSLIAQAVEYITSMRLELTRRELQ